MSTIEVLNVLLEVITSACTTPPLICSPAHCTPNNANHTLFFAKVNHELHDISHNSVLHLWEHVIDDYCLLKPHVPLNWIAQPCFLPTTVQSAVLRVGFRTTFPA